MGACFEDPNLDYLGKGEIETKEGFMISYIEEGNLDQNNLTILIACMDFYL